MEGIDLQWHDIEVGKPSYLRGEWQDRGRWYWYLYALAVKAPLGTWGLFLLAVGVRVARWWKRWSPKSKVQGPRSKVATNSRASQSSSGPTDKQSKIRKPKSKIRRPSPRPSSGRRGSGSDVEGRVGAVGAGRGGAGAGQLADGFQPLYKVRAAGLPVCIHLDFERCARDGLCRERPPWRSENSRWSAHRQGPERHRGRSLQNYLERGRTCRRALGLVDRRQPVVCAALDVVLQRAGRRADGRTRAFDRRPGRLGPGSARSETVARFEPGMPSASTFFTAIRTPPPTDLAAKPP